MEGAELNRVLKGKRKRKEDIVLSESECEEDLEIPSPKSKQLDTLLTVVKGMQHDLGAMLAVKKNSKLPPGLYVKLRETFKCHICHSTPINPPVIITRCCKSILGCEGCVDIGMLEMWEGQRHAHCVEPIEPI